MTTENCSNFDTPREIALCRCNQLIEQYLDWKKKDHKRSDYSQICALFFTAITPVILIMPGKEYIDIIKVIAAATSAAAAISTGVLSISGWRENYIRYGYTWHALQTEKFRFLTKATNDYSGNEDDAVKYFSNRIEDIHMTEVKDWRDAIQNHNQSVVKE